MDQVPNSNNGKIDQTYLTHKRVLRLEQCYYLAKSRKQVICEDLVKYSRTALMSLENGRRRRTLMGKKKNSSTGLHIGDSTGTGGRVSKQHPDKTFLAGDRTGWKETGRRTLEGWDIPCYRYASLGGMERQGVKVVEGFEIFQEGYCWCSTIEVIYRGRYWVLRAQRGLGGG